ncbi:MAG: 16S rRNA (cytosine(967)-C(5))-methyltransferase RsmB [Betaproteobacteria bacterium]|nr:16S rRNA (cytosine(967)-C(5))-methyltransferase RsmB [Betaproteobacteria bacterium]
MLQIQRLAAQTVANVISGTSLNVALDSVWRRNRHLTTPDRGAIQDICYGTLRYLGKLTAVLDQLATKPIASPELRILLLTVLYQLEYSDAAPYAVVDHAVECAVQLGGEHVRSFANAVLRNYQRRREVLLANAELLDEGRFSYPDWWVDRLRRDFGPDAERILEIGNRHPPMTLRTNVRRGSVSDYLQRLRQAGLEVRRLDNGALLLARPMPVDRLPGFGDGAASVQDAGAQFAATLLGVRDGMRVLDACSAPGGKTAHILELADVEMVALDADAVRLQRVGSNLERLGLSARLQAADAAVPDAWWDGKQFERVLLDAPCSASGVVRRHPDIKWLRRPSDIAGFAAQQQRLLEALWKVVARGGKLLYVTCSIFSEEDHETIGSFAARHPDARILGGMPGRDGLLLPDDEHDGFYYALLQKD